MTNPVAGVERRPDGGLQMALDNIRQRVELAYGQRARVDVDVEPDRDADGLAALCTELREQGHLVGGLQVEQQDVRIEGGLDLPVGLRDARVDRLRARHARGLQAAQLSAKTTLPRCTLGSPSGSRCFAPLPSTTSSRSSGVAVARKNSAMSAVWSSVAPQ